jgi:probable selenium-dependent hydroxylase accessory protein YqeC
LKLSNSLHSFLDIESQGGQTPVISVVGAGGKTTILFSLASSMATDLPGTIIICGTTRFTLGTPTPAVWSFTDVINIGITTPLPSTIVVSNSITPGDKGRFSPLDNGQIAQLVQLRQIAAVLVNADGSRMRPFKAPKPEEPILPNLTTHVICLVGADALGLPITAEAVHRPDEIRLVLDLVGLSELTRLDSSAISEVIVRTYGSIAKLAGCEFSVVVHKADYHDAAQAIAKALTETSFFLEREFPIVLSKKIGTQVMLSRW